jgi:tetratricopeptide (TPR) repeat protein
MNHSEKDIALVEKYFDAELNDSEMNHFTSRLESDENFKTLVEQEKAILGAIRHQGLTENLQYLETLEASLGNRSHVRLQAPVKKWYYAAAAVTIGVLIVGKILLNSFNESPDKLFEAYFTPYPNTFEPTVRGNSAISKRSQAFEAYEQGDYENAAILFSELLATNKEPGMLLLLGNANLILGNVEKAKENFAALNKDFDELDIQSKWYLSLCYLKSGDVERARTMLKELGKTEIAYANKAKELLDKVD